MVSLDKNAHDIDAARLASGVRRGEYAALAPVNLSDAPHLTLYGRELARIIGGPLRASR